MTSNKPSVAVVGLGAIGSMTLWRLAAAGVRATGFERFTPGHDGAAYGGQTRQLRLASHDAHGSDHVRLGREALALWRDLEAASGSALYTPSGQLAVGPADDPELESLIRCLERDDLEHHVLSSAQVALRYPAHRLADDEIGILSVEAGVLRSNRAVYEATRVAEGLGATVHRQCAVRDIVAGANGIEIEAGGSRHRFDHVVVTAGPWVGRLAPRMSSVVVPRKIVCAWYPPATGTTLGPEVFPPGFRRSRVRNDYTFLPSVDGSGVKIIYWLPLRPEIADGTSWDMSADADTLAAASRALTVTMPGLISEAIEATAYPEGFTPDRWPVIDVQPSGITCLAGFSGSGFAISPTLGQIAADLATGRTPGHDVGSMSIDRFDLIDGAQRRDALAQSRP